MIKRHNSLDFIPDYFEKIKEYTPSPSGKGRVSLDAMESPFGFEKWIDPWIKNIKEVEVNRYPGQANEILKSMRQFFPIPDSAELMAANGSDELIQMLLLLCGCKDLRVLSPAPSFVMYEHLTRVLDGEYIKVDLNEDFTLSLSEFQRAIEEKKPKIIFLAQPNNPTGQIFDSEIIQAALDSKALTVVDCAYSFFSKIPSLPSMEQYPNLAVLYTMSKIGMAGLRFGFIAAHPELILQLNKIRLPYNVNSLTLASLESILPHMQSFIEYAQASARERDKMYDRLLEIGEIHPYQSATNFILFRCLSRTADEVEKSLLEKNILVRNLNGAHPLLKQCLRVSMGRSEENTHFLSALESSV